MHRIIALYLAIILFSSHAVAITTQEYTEAFQQFKGCFVLYDLNKHKIVSEYNPNNNCNTRIAPDSTFKIALSLMAFNEKVINQHTVFKWDGVNRVLPDWNQDQTPSTWIKYSAVWVSQLLTPQLGYQKIKQYLAAFHYGNQDFKGDPGKHNGLSYAWLSSSLKISAFEQLDFLKSMLSNQLPVSSQAVTDTKENMYLGKLENGAELYGKTGSGRHGNNERETNPSKLRDGWFVGFVEKDAQPFIFVSNLTDKSIPDSQDKSYGSQLLKPITLKLLNSYFVNDK